MRGGEGGRERGREEEGERGRERERERRKLYNIMQECIMLSVVASYYPKYHSLPYTVLFTHVPKFIAYLL